MINQCKNIYIYFLFFAYDQKLKNYNIKSTPKELMQWTIIIITTQFINYLFSDNLNIKGELLNKIIIVKVTNQITTVLA